MTEPDVLNKKILYKFWVHIMKSMDKNPVCPNLAKKSLKGPKNGVFGVLTKIKANVLFIVKSEKSHGPLSFCENHMSGKRGQVWDSGPK